MSIIQGSAMQGASRGFYPKEIEGSLRFNSGDTSYLYWEPSSAGNRKTWTWSGWVKGNLSKAGLFAAGNDITVNNNYMAIVVESDYTLRLVAYNTNAFACKTNAVFRDPSAWYHFVVAFDTTQATAANRVKIYVNGVLQSLNSPTYPNQNVEHFINNNIDHALGRMFESDYYTNGYLAEVFFIDGTAHDADDFGETKNGVWVPKNITASDFTMGTNGFHLTFEDDTEVEAFNTTLHRGNGGTQSVTGTGFSPDLVWIKNRDNADNHYLFDTVRGANRYLNSDTTGAEDYSSNDLNSFDSDGFTVGSDGGLNRSGQAIVAWQWDAGANNASTGHSSITWTGSSATQKISGLPFRPDLVWIKARNVAYGSQLFDSVRGANKRLSSNVTNAEVSDTDALMSFDSDGFILGAEDGVNDSTYTYVGWAWDAGDSDPVSNTDGSITSTVKASQANGFSIVTFTSNGSSGQTIGHGLGVAPKMVIAKNRSSTGNWWVYHYDIGNANYMELNTTIASTGGANVWSSTHPSSTVVYSGLNSLVPTSGHEVVMYCFADVTGKQKFGTYTGNGSADGPEVTLGFRPGFVMLKRTNDTSNWRIYDSSRNPLNDVSHDLYPDTSDSEGTTDAIRFTDDGFKLVFAGGTGLNASGSTYIYAAFAGSYSDYITDYNTDGSIDSRVKASDTTGFSIVSYVGTGANATVGHGLSSAPDWAIFRDRDTSNNWGIYHSSLGETKSIKLNVTDAAFDEAAIFNDTAPTSSVISLGNSGLCNSSGNRMIAYCWTATTGVSSFGSYTGTGSNQTINFGFRPAFFLTKSTSAGDPWVILDATRETVNDRNFVLQPNSSAVEDTDNDDVVEFTDTGVVIKSTSGWSNRSGIDYIYAAFADTREAAFWLDQSSNDNDWQPNNLDHNDTVADSPTDNFATLNPLNSSASATLSDGNLKHYNTANDQASTATFAISSGKWYWEVTTDDGAEIGLIPVNQSLAGLSTVGAGSYAQLAVITNGTTMRTPAWATTNTTGLSAQTGTFGVVVDADAGKMWVTDGSGNYVNNGNPTTGANPQATFDADWLAQTGGGVVPYALLATGIGKEMVFNFGQQPFKYNPPE